MLHAFSRWLGQRARSVRSGWAALVLSALVLAACSARQPEGAGASLVAGKAPLTARGVRHASALTDGVAARPGDDWEVDLAAQFVGQEASVTFDLGAVVSVRALWLQADHNDAYRVYLSEDGSAFHLAWDPPPVKAAGLQERSIATLDARARYLRLEPSGGDQRFAVAELGVFERVPAAFPEWVARRRGVPLEVIVRTKVLSFVAAAIAALLFAYRGAPRWWLAVCGALPLATLVDAICAFADAWPVEPRQVSIVRAAVAAIAAAAVLRETSGPARYQPHRAICATAYGFSALLAMLAFYNLGRPQFWDDQRRELTPAHLLDLRQYYGSVKYFDEIGYRGLFLADVAAYVEDTPGVSLDALADLPMRDLETHRISTVGAQRSKIEAIEQQFSPERWRAYKEDARYFRAAMGKDAYLHYMIDHGANATPVWISVAHLLFDSFEVSTRGFEVLALLDPLLFLVTFGAIARCFGLRSMAIAMVVFGANDFVMFGTNWGGATLRHDWLMLIGLGACALTRQRWALGGVLLGVSTMIRAFPAITLVTLALPATWWLFEQRRAGRRWPTWRELQAAHGPTLRVLGAALLTGLVLVAATSLRWSLWAWGDWLAKVARLSADPHINSVALRGLFAGSQVGHTQLLRARLPLVVAGTIFYVAAVALTCRKLAPARAALAGLMLVPVVFYAANYYIHVICFLPLLAVERRGAHVAHGPPLSRADAAVWLTLLGLCVAQYWTVLVDDVHLHFHLATVLLFVALTVIVVVQMRAGVREGRLDFVARFFAEPGASQRRADDVVPT